MRKAAVIFVQESGASDQYLQNTACTNFAREKSKAQRESYMRSPTCQGQRINTAKHFTHIAGTASAIYHYTVNGNIHVYQYNEDGTPMKE